MRNIRLDSIREAVEAFGVHDYEDLRGHVAPDGSWHDIPAGRVAEGPDQVVAYFKEWHKAFADAHVTDARYTELPDGRVLVECKGEGKQTGQFGPFANTGGSFSLPSIMVCSFDDGGLVTRVDLYYDTMTMLTQLGHMQAMAA